VALRVTRARARAHWHARAGLAEPEAGSLDEVLARTGWLRTLGGIEAYLAVRARVPGARRVDVDAAIEGVRVQVVPAVRGCIYVVPRAHVALALRVAEEQQAKRSAREMAVVGVKDTELEAVGKTVLAALGAGPLATDALRRALPEGTVRSFGEAGKKIGLSSTLPLALRKLEFSGRVERLPEGARLDTERYLWRVAAKSPFAGARVPDHPVERHARLAELFFRHGGPATARDFASWTALSERDALAAMARAPLAPVAVDGYAEDAWALEEDLATLAKPARPSDRFALLGFEDAFLVHHGGPAPLVSASEHGRKVASWGSARPTTLGAARHLHLRPVLDGDRLGGFWELDPGAGAIVLFTFEELSPKRRRLLEARAADVASFIASELGHARSVSLDTTEAVAKRAAEIRRMR
jgi:hypothetical protein